MALVPPSSLASLDSLDDVAKVDPREPEQAEWKAIWPWVGPEESAPELRYPPFVSAPPGWDGSCFEIPDPWFDSDLPGAAGALTIAYYGRFNGASIPPAFWDSIAHPLRGDLQGPALVHDFLYDHPEARREVFAADQDPGRDVVDDLFVAMLQANGVPPALVTLLDVGVRLFGWAVYSRRTQNGPCSAFFGDLIRKLWVFLRERANALAWPEDPDGVRFLADKASGLHPRHDALQAALRATTGPDLDAALARELVDHFPNELLTHTRMELQRGEAPELCTAGLVLAVATTTALPGPALFGV